MSLILKETLQLLKNYTVFVPYSSTPFVMVKKSVNIETFRNVYGLVFNPVYSYNEKYCFISDSFVKKDLKYYNKIASKIKNADMYGNIIIYKLVDMM